MTRSLAPLILGLGCRSADLPATWDYAGTADPGTDLSDDAVVAGVEATLAVVARLDPMLALAPYGTALGHADPTCPAFNSAYAPQTYWEDDCSTPEGVEFRGWALSFVGHDLPEGDLICARDGTYYGFSQVTAPASDSWAGWGELRFKECTNPDDGIPITDATWRGDFSWPNAGWVSEALTLELYGHFVGGAEGPSVTLDGGLSGLPGDIAGAWFDELTVPGGGCEAEGTLTAYTADGTAYTLAYGDICDGCAELTRDGEPMGTVCPDLSSLIAFEEWPWG